MLDKSHDPSEYIRGLQQLLVSDKKKIAFLFGAGTSLGKKNGKSITVPAIGRMTDEIEEVLNENKIYADALIQIRAEIECKNASYNIESLLSNLEQKVEIIGAGKLNGLTHNNFVELLEEVKNEIRKRVSIHDAVLNEIENLLHVDFSEWVRRNDRKQAVEIFTTNYDYLFEIGLEEKSIPFYDGFTGGFKPFFNSDSVEDMSFIPNQTKLWKIHGSLGWHYDFSTNKVWRKDSSSDDILIYPSTLKYNASKKQPYTALMDRLSNFLKQSDTVLITCGYSFGDQHINERILTALKTNTSAHVIALFYDINWDGEKKSGYQFNNDSALAELAKNNNKLSVFGCKSAVIGGQYGKWRLKREPSKEDTINVTLYFDEDGSNDINDEVGVEKIGDEKWTGEGEMILPDFSKFVRFLQEMIPNNEFRDVDK